MVNLAGSPFLFSLGGVKGSLRLEVEDGQGRAAFIPRCAVRFAASAAGEALHGEIEELSRNGGRGVCRSAGRDGPARRTSRERGLRVLRVPRGLGVRDWNGGAARRR